MLEHCTPKARVAGVFWGAVAITSWNGFFGFAAACDSHAGTDSLREWYRPLEHQDQDDASGMAAIKKELHAACDLGGTYSYVARRPLTSFQ